MLVPIVVMAPLSQRAAYPLPSSGPLLHKTFRRVQDGSAPIPSETLAAALAPLSWDVGQRGPLLAVNPQGSVAVPPARPLLPSEPTGDANLRALAARFDRQVLPLGSLTALIPTTMVTLNSRPGPPDPYAGLRRSEKIRLLMGSLTPAQWRALGSAQGLGIGDLSLEQQPLFVSLLPEPFALSSYKMDNGIKLSQPDRGVTLTPQQRAGVHLRVTRVADVYLPQPGGGFGFPPDLQYYGLPNGTEFYTLASGYTSPSPSAFGVDLRAQVPNRLKPGSLSFEAPILNKAVTLDGAKTVGGLMRRITDATHLEIIADGRVAVLPVWTRGQSARAGDILQALCLAVTGTIRRVGPAFVLTSDLEGIGTRHARLGDWARKAYAQRRATLDAADKAGANARPEQYIGFAPDYPFAFSPAALQTLTANGPERGQMSRYDVLLSSLPPAQQTLIRAYFAHQQQETPGDRVKVALTSNFSYVIPGFGNVNEADITYGNIGLPSKASPPVTMTNATVALPAGFATRALFVRPANARLAAQFARAAHVKGLNQLWVEVGEGASEIKLLRETVAAAKENQLQVVAVLRLLRTARPDANAPALPEDARDKNLLDETGSAYAARMAALAAQQPDIAAPDGSGYAGDWLRPDAPDALAYLQARLREIAVTPGLAGIALKDTAPPGYLDKGSRADPFSFTYSGDFGYTPATRLAYLRQSGYDPIDLLGGTDLFLNADLSLPFFSAQAGSFQFSQETGQLEARGERTPLQEWAAYRYKSNARLLAALRVFAHQNYPDLPLLLKQSPLLEGWWSGWDKSEKLPEVLSMNREVTSAQAGQVSSLPLLLNIAYAGSPTPSTIPASAGHFAMWVQTRLKQRGQGWNGVVLDLSALSSTQALDMLAGLNARSTL